MHSCKQIHSCHSFTDLTKTALRPKIPFKIMLIEVVDLFYIALFFRKAMNAGNIVLGGPNFLIFFNNCHTCLRTVSV